MTVRAKSAGAWHPGQTKFKQGGAWGPATLYRKTAGVWQTDAPLVASAAPATLTVAGTGASPSTTAAKATPNGGVSPDSYAWTKVSGGDIVAATPGAASTTFAPGAALTQGETRTAVYKCTVTDSLGTEVDTGTVTISLTRWTQPVASVVPTSLSAVDSTAAKTTAATTASVASGTAPFAYAWTKVSGGAITITSPSASSTTFSASGLTAGESRTATFRCAVTDAHGLTSTANVSVAIGRTAATFNATASPSTLSASGASGSVTTASATASVSGGSGPYAYAWTKVSGAAINITSPSAASTTFGATGLAAGESRTATFRCTVTDSNGQTDATGTVSVTITSTASTGATYTPAAGTYNASDVGTVHYTVSASASVPWTWSASNTVGLSANVASGASGTSITFTMVAPLHSDRSTVITLQSGGKTWTLNLTAYASGGATSTSAIGGKR